MPLILATRQIYVMIYFVVLLLCVKYQYYFELLSFLSFSSARDIFYTDSFNGSFLDNIFIKQ
jgi:hypothetical protein